MGQCITLKGIIKICSHNYNTHNVTAAKQQYALNGESTCTETGCQGHKPGR